MNQRAVAILLLLMLQRTVTALSQQHRQRSNGLVYRIGVIGGGASGMFAATAAAEALQKQQQEQQRQNQCLTYEVVVLEAAKRTMTKVKISGGGRCNLLHDTSLSPSNILRSYPRGRKELNGLFAKHFTPREAQIWFETRGVAVKTEADGRMFPQSDKSETVMTAITDSALRAGVSIRTNQKVTLIQKHEYSDDDDDMFLVTSTAKREGIIQEDRFHSIILATGSSPIGYEFAKQLRNHTIIQPVPSLFTLHAKQQVQQEDGILYGLSGLSVPWARLSLHTTPGLVPSTLETQQQQQSTTTVLKRKTNKKTILTAEGPLLITHHGISGPATLRLSAFAAREFHELTARGDDVIVVMVHWVPECGTRQEIEAMLWNMTQSHPKRIVSSACPLVTTRTTTKDVSSCPIPKRLWTALVKESGFHVDNAVVVVRNDNNNVQHTRRPTMWGDASKTQISNLARTICEFPIYVTGKSVFKEEFVTAGGVALTDITMKSMESKKCPNLYFCGEVIDVDGITGGFNFMNCWSTGFVAGTNAAAAALVPKKGETL